MSLLFVAAGVRADTAAHIENCDACHGPGGVSTESDVPTIAGFSQLVLEEYMFQYAEKARPCRESEYRYGDTGKAATTMCTVAEQLSEDDISDIAEHYARKEFVAADQPFDAGLAKQGAAIHRRDCEKCHTDGGSYAGDDAGRLAGQWASYIEESIIDYQTGGREMLENKMKVKIDALDESAIAALVQYYVSLK